MYHIQGIGFYFHQIQCLKVAIHVQVKFVGWVLSRCFYLLEFNPESQLRVQRIKIPISTLTYIVLITGTPVLASPDLVNNVLSKLMPLRLESVQPCFKILTRWNILSLTLIAWVNWHYFWKRKIPWGCRRAQFTVITDCASLIWLHRLREPTGRWCLFVTILVTGST